MVMVLVAQAVLYAGKTPLEPTAVRTNFGKYSLVLGKPAVELVVVPKLCVTTATVSVSTNLITWQMLRSVPVVNGSAVFTDNTATNLTTRFYRVSLPQSVPTPRVGSHVYLVAKKL